MAPYQYQKLDTARQEIRLLTLLPGKTDEDLCGYITHAPLIDPGPRESTRASLEEVQATLPEPWRVYETWSGRYLFNGPGTTSWSHPLDHIDRSLYEDPESDFDDRSVTVYEALSYTWDEPGDGGQNYISMSKLPNKAPGLDSKRSVIAKALHLPSRKRPSRPEAESSTVTIRPNLAACLKALRSPRQEYTLWIDAICINQDDTAERSVEVGRMGSIFQLAQRVVVWLGLSSDETPLAFQTLVYLGAQTEVLRNKSCIYAPEADTTWFRAAVDLPYSDAEWSAIQDIISRRWFDRLWVLQEITLANSKAVVQCGDYVMSWTRLRNALAPLTDKHNLPNARMRNRLRHLESFWDMAQVLTPSEVLRRTSGLHCLDPADKIYAILSLIPPLFKNKIEPDYTLRIEEIYRRALMAMIEEAQVLTPLASCHLTHRRINSPSWVPDWSMPKLTEPFEHWILAAGNSRDSVKLIDSDTLSVTGRAISRVQLVSSAYAAEDGLLYTLAQWKDLAIGATTASRLENFVMTLITDRTDDIWPNAGLPSRAQCLKEFCSVMDASKTTPEQIAEGWVFSEASKSMKNRHFIVTEDGQFGLGPPGVEPGDVVALLLGLDTHMCIRGDAQNSSKFKVVGECYIYGQENATGFLGPLPPDWSHCLDSSTGFAVCMFKEASTGRITNRDPRGPLPEGWDLKTWKDPRLSPEALEERGVELQDFLLI
ncbi:heterokaryon incompatibility protein-domain-containing protein [Lophiotrema nucula]|uniref:Heterokaryon incompatibility protein-domain-containing protein n=1 Tax=Lophiotrema nucula TaxID=690887 RepID=A0A6A5ZH67_9PLEO|nr:heterokaryon incompatibility protein-domain-containing protein [Lophiotrema nucula]